jgi:hypothetical protein
LLAKADSQLLAEVVAGDDESALDQYLAYREVDLPDDLAASSSTGRILHEQDVRTGVDHRDAALREERSLAAGGRRLPGASAELLLAVGRDQFCRSDALM